MPELKRWTNDHVGLIRVELGNATQTVNFFWVFDWNTIWSSQTLSASARNITRPHRWNPTLNIGTFYIM